MYLAVLPYSLKKQQDSHILRLLIGGELAQSIFKHNVSKIFFFFKITFTEVTYRIELNIELLPFNVPQRENPHKYKERELKI